MDLKINKPKVQAAPIRHRSLKTPHHCCPKEKIIKVYETGECQLDKMLVFLCELFGIYFDVFKACMAHRGVTGLRRVTLQ